MGTRGLSLSDYEVLVSVTVARASVYQDQVSINENFWERLRDKNRN